MCLSGSGEDELFSWLADEEAGLFYWRKGDDQPLVPVVLDVRARRATWERELLTEHGLLLRYRTETGVDGLEPGEHPFLACSFWLVEQYAHTIRKAEARALMDMLVGFSNEPGLLSEEFTPAQERMAGNFPQAFFTFGPGAGG